MPRLYETKDEQANRELRDLYAGRESVQTFPPRIVKSRPRYQPLTVAAARGVAQTRAMFNKIRKVTGRAPV